MKKLVILCILLMGCAVETISTAQHTSERVFTIQKLLPFNGQSVGSGIFQTDPQNFAGVWQPVMSGDFLGVPLPVESGERIESVSASVWGSAAWTVRMQLVALDAADLVLGSDESAPTATQQSLSVDSTETVDDSFRAYFVQFVGTKLSAGFSPRIGPIVLTTSIPN